MLIGVDGEKHSSARVQQLLASGDKVGATEAYRDEANVDLPTASRFIESL